MSAHQAKVVGSPTEVYARVARAASACWFTNAGPLVNDHVYSAEAEPASRGGKAEFVVHAKDPTIPNRRGSKVYRIRIEPTGKETSVTTENIKLSEPLAVNLTKDVERWSQGEIGCAQSQQAATWNAVEPSAETAAAALKPKSTKQPPSKTAKRLSQ